MGLNTVETYVPWNLHQPEPGTARPRRLPRPAALPAPRPLRGTARPAAPRPVHLRRVGRRRPALLAAADPDIRLRSRDPRFTDAVDRYLDLLLPPIVPQLAARGGPVIAVQVENEYGAYGDDTALPRTPRRSPCARRGVDVPALHLRPARRSTSRPAACPVCSPPPPSAAGSRPPRSSCAPISPKGR